MVLGMSSKATLLESSGFIGKRYSDVAKTVFMKKLCLKRTEINKKRPGLANLNIVPKRGNEESKRLKLKKRGLGVLP